MSFTPLISQVSIDTGLPVPDLLRIIRNAPLRYKRFEILKRDGTPRVIAQPARELKEVQRYIVTNLLSELPVHSSATGYKLRTSIKDNAKPHLRSEYVLKLDFQDFFPSIRPIDLFEVMRNSNVDIDDKDIGWMIRVLFYGYGKNEPYGLSIGAPSSPFISNVVMWKFDEFLAEKCLLLGCEFTRYADDITISGEREVLEGMVRVVREWLSKSNSPKLVLNDKKTGIYGRGARRVVTGLVLTPEGSVSLGRARKRAISARVHRFKLGLLNRSEASSLLGMISFARSIEEDFVKRLEVKYGTETFEALRRSGSVHRVP